MVKTPEELGHWLRLSLTPGVGAEAARRLLAAFGEPEAIFEQSESALRQVVTALQAQALRQIPSGWPELTEETWDWLHAETKPATESETATAPIGRAVVTLGDDDYPGALLEISDPPLMLYAMGQIQALRHLKAAQTVAMVGSRNPTPQGQINAREFARSLAASGLTVVSGMALGVDGAAHEGALLGALLSANFHVPTPMLNVTTVAVVGTGLDRVYPKQHRDLAHRIAQRGLILSEYALGTPPLAPNFPRRNRLISGLAQATLVVEAALQSGSLITAKQALEQGRDVMAIPGSIHSAQSKGCHLLIKQGAKLVESAQDVLEELRLPDPFAQIPLALPGSPKQGEVRGAGASGGVEGGVEGGAGGGAGGGVEGGAGGETGVEDGLEGTTTDEIGNALRDEQALLHALGHDPVSLDALQARCGWPTAQLQAQLLELELMGQVGRLPGGLFQRIGSA